WYWDGAEWKPVAVPAGLDGRGVWYLHRLGPMRWFGCGEAGSVHIFTPFTRERELSKTVDSGVRLTTAGIRSESDFVAAGLRKGVPHLFPCRAGKYQSPIAASCMGEVMAITPFGE